MNTVTEGVNVTTEEAGRLATGLVGAAAAERDEAPKPAGRVRLGSTDLYLDGEVAAEARPYTSWTGLSGGWVRLGPLHVHGTWDDLAAFFAAGLAAVREQSTGPVGA